MSNKSLDPERLLERFPEPDAFSAQELAVWRGLLRLREAVTREIDRRLREEGEITLDDYGVLITLVTAPRLRLRMGDLGTRHLLTPSGITRLVTRLEQRGLLRREPDPEDGRAAFAALTEAGLRALRRAQVVHHAVVRELYVGRLDEHDLDVLAELFEKALPGAVNASVWPPAPTA